MKPSRRVLVLFLLAVLGFILTLRAKECWERKPYNEWNEQEAMAMLTHSPWSQSSTISPNYAGTSPPGTLHLDGEFGAGPTSSDRGMSSGIGGVNSIPLQVRWCSSQEGPPSNGPSQPVAQESD